jgi:formylglycine-generating enzyme required for sulfatase activity
MPAPHLDRSDGSLRPASLAATGGALKPRRLVAAVLVALAAAACSAGPASVPVTFSITPGQFSLPSNTPRPPSATLNVRVVTPFQSATPTALPTETAGAAMTGTPAVSLTITPIRWQVSPIDGMKLVYVPAGGFWMGSQQDLRANLDEFPVHRLTLNAFWIDQTEVTNAMYATCVQVGACQPPASSASSSHPSYYGQTEFADYPVIFVNWNQAKTYCSWAGRRLLTEAEWEKAARSNTAQLYTWGWFGSPMGRRSVRLNFCDAECPFSYRQTDIDDGYADVAPVGSYPEGASPYAVLDMAGNVWEWVSDWYGANYYASSPPTNPTGPDSGEGHVIRGGSWLDTFANVRVANRYFQNADAATTYTGIRCGLSDSP